MPGDPRRPKDGLGRLVKAQGDPAQEAPGRPGKTQGRPKEGPRKAPGDQDGLRKAPGGPGGTRRALESAQQGPKKTPGMRAGERPIVVWDVLCWGKSRGKSGEPGACGRMGLDHAVQVAPRNPCR